MTHPQTINPGMSQPGINSINSLMFGWQGILLDNCISVWLGNGLLFY